MGRPALQNDEAMISFKLTEDELDRFDELARVAKLSRRALARSLILAILEDDVRTERKVA